MAGNVDNLVKGDEIHKFTPEEHSKGGKASAKVRREKRLMREQLQMLLALDVKSNKIKQKMTALGIEESEQNNQMTVVLSLYQKAISGDTKAIEMIRDFNGERPVEQIQQIETPQILDDIE